MLWLEGLFWLSVVLAAYTYFGYALVAMILSWLLGRPHRSAPMTPRVALVIPAYDEEEVIADKIRNCLSLDYPHDRLEIVVVADGSTDRTQEIAASFRGIRIEYRPERRGKIHAINRVMPLLDSEVIVCSDANSFLNPESLRLMVRHFADPQVACVAGEKRIQDRRGDVSAGEGLYWRYESYLKRLDSRLGSVMGAAGEIVAFRRSCYEAVEPDTIIEDFVLSMRLLHQGYRVVYEPEAYSLEAASLTIGEEFKRKARIVAGGWQAVLRLGGLLWPNRPLVTFQYVSHRVLRWVLVPHLLVVALTANLVLAWGGPAYFRGLLLLQVAFYLTACCGYFMQQKGGRFPLCYVPFYFVFVNVAALAGCYRFWTRRQPQTWEKVRRATTVRG